MYSLESELGGVRAKNKGYRWRFETLEERMIEQNYFIQSWDTTQIYKLYKSSKILLKALKIKIEAKTSIFLRKYIILSTCLVYNQYRLCSSPAPKIGCKLSFISFSTWWVHFLWGVLPPFSFILILLATKLRSQISKCEHRFLKPRWINGYNYAIKKINRYLVLFSISLTYTTSAN